MSWFGLLMLPLPLPLPPGENCILVTKAPPGPRLAFNGSRRWILCVLPAVLARSGDITANCLLPCGIGVSFDIGDAMPRDTARTMASLRLRRLESGDTDRDSIVDSTVDGRIRDASASEGDSSPGPPALRAFANDGDGDDDNAASDDVLLLAANT